MNRKICMALLCLFTTHYCFAQRFVLQPTAANDSASMAQQIALLAGGVIKTYRDTERENYLGNLFRLQMLAGNYRESLVTINTLCTLSPRTADNITPNYLPYELFAKAQMGRDQNPGDFKKAYTSAFNSTFEKLDDKTAYRSINVFSSGDGVDALKGEFQNSLLSARKETNLTLTEALSLCRRYYDYWLYRQTEAITSSLIRDDLNRRYTVKSRLVTTSTGSNINVIVVLKKGISHAQPAVLQYTIYADSSDIRIFKAAAYGYAGVTAYTRGKGTSPDKIVPYEHDGEDANDVITWISRQSWCNGKVGMYGGSYNGFTQWAAAKYHNQALKTIVPYVAAIPGLGLPMENNVFITANYGWAFYVTDNKYLDNKIYYDPQRWRSLNFKWFSIGAAYNKIDSIDGTPNPWLQRWLKHPDYDSYWQRQVPYQHDFAKINIPVLTFEGYYDDGQVSGLHYYLEHLKYNSKANHYLIIGPYDHFGTQSGGVPVLRGYKVDPVELISTSDITFQWLDHILKGAKMPGIIKDKVNYEVMGANKWRHAPSIAGMADKRLRLYLTDAKSSGNYLLSPQRPLKKAALGETVDLASRDSSYGDYYPAPIIKDQLDHSNGLFFISKPFDKPVMVNGMFSGELKAIINKKDMDVTVVLYEVTPDGKYFELSYFLGRASYAKDMAKRALLHPGKEETIPFTRPRMFSRQLSKGSRLLVVLNTDKNPFAEVNYGTGKDVAAETAEDGKIPLKIKWFDDSYIDVPVMESR